MAFIQGHWKCWLQRLQCYSLWKNPVVIREIPRYQKWLTLCLSLGKMEWGLGEFLSIPVKTVKHAPLESIFKLLKAIRNNCFRLDQLDCLLPWDGMLSRQQENNGHLLVRMVFGTGPKRFSLNLSKYGLQEQFVRYIANWFYHHSKRVVESMLWVPVGYKQSTLWFGTGTHIAQLFHQQIRWWHRICPQVNLQI